MYVLKEFKMKLVIAAEEDELSPYITVRLALARAKAMAKYREVWG